MRGSRIRLAVACTLAASSLAACAGSGHGGHYEAWYGSRGCGHFETGDPVVAAIVGGFVLVVILSQEIGRACEHACNNVQHWPRRGIDWDSAEGRSLRRCR
jgi:hypothetical protein